MGPGDCRSPQALRVFDNLTWLAMYHGGQQHGVEVLLALGSPPIFQRLLPLITSLLSARH